MDGTQTLYNTNPRKDANFFSILFFGYTIPTFRKGFKKDLNIEDVHTTLPQYQSDMLTDLLEKNWNKELEESKENPKKTPSLLRTVIRTYWVEFFLYGILLAIPELLFKTTLPLFLGKILDHYTVDATVTKFETYACATAMVCLLIANSVLLNQYILNTLQCGLKMRVSLCGLVYRKAIKLHSTVISNSASTYAVNLLSSDATRLDHCIMIFHQIWTGPISAVIIMGMLYNVAGPSAIFGILIIFLMSPLQAYIGKFTAFLRAAVAKKTDRRLKVINEITLGIQIIKMYAWELPFQKVVERARKSELLGIKTTVIFKTTIAALLLIVTNGSFFLTLFMMRINEEEITASKIFVVMTYFNILNQTLINVFITTVTGISEILVTTKRYQTFLRNEEYKQGQIVPMVSNEFEKYVMVVNNMSAKWNSSDNECVVKNINLKIKKGKLIGITGPVGTGKTSLLQALLGELNIVKGTVNIKGKCSYASQESWIFAATIRQNILFGASFDKKRYNNVLRVCALNQDLTKFPNGDMTLIGEKGISLSGGQKARINLARAVYRNVDIYLFDDPLSAVDVHVSKILYEQCINGFLSNKTRILVTHQIQYLDNADDIIILKNGTIEGNRNYNISSENNNIYAQLLLQRPNLTKSETLDKYMLDHKNRKNEENDYVYQETKPELIDMQEKTTTGSIGSSLIRQYLKYNTNTFNLLLVISFFLLCQTANCLTSYFLSIWANIEEEKLQEFMSERVDSDNLRDKFHIVFIKRVYSANWSSNVCLYVYAALIGTSVILSIGKSVSYYTMTSNCSRNIHAKLLDGVIYTQMRFFQINPNGRLLNRFAKDISSLDEILPELLNNVIQGVLQIFGGIVLIGLTNPYSVGLAIFLGVITNSFRRVYTKTACNLKRTVAALQSPIYIHLTATMQGLATIRALGTEKILIEEFDRFQNYLSSACFMSSSCSSAFGFFIDMVCATFTAFLIFTILIFDEAMHLTAGEIGLAITQSMFLSSLVQIIIKVMAETLNQLTSLERVAEYNNLPPELQPKDPNYPPENWPNSGMIEFVDVQLKYCETEPTIFKDLSLVINPQEKIGIVGRTGAGKSSLINALFRLANIEGKIIIDGINTQEILLQNLRSKISIIPQDPVLFSGTLRYNLDPLNEHPDDKLYAALREVELKDSNNKTHSLDHIVQDDGSNFSVGQKQLICLVRAIMRKNKIIVLDEVTANVDVQTDQLIQSTIRDKFSDCTVIIVAHRLNTIIDCDKVLVMDQGKIAEFEHPHILLLNENGIFRKMIEDIGEAMSESLKKTAHLKYQESMALQK